jgi:hypothetical protein
MEEGNVIGIAKIHEYDTQNSLQAPSFLLETLLVS